MGNLNQTFWLYLFVFSLFWVGPLAFAVTSAVKRNRSMVVCGFAAILLSPLGWVAAQSLTYVRVWIIGASIFGPVICGILVRILPRGTKPSTHSSTASLAIILGILAYSFWSARCGYLYVAYTSMGSSAEHAIVGSLGSLRSALQIYQSDTGKFPPQLSDLIPKYLDHVPGLQAISRDGIILHLPSAEVHTFGDQHSDDKGGWGYINAPTTPGGHPNPNFGKVFINCTHFDLRGTKRLSDY